MTNDERAAERERIRDLLKTALSRGYTDAQLRDYIVGAVAMSDEAVSGT